ncbi:MAG: ABC transporter permease subunit [Bacteroidota bacterium]
MSLFTLRGTLSKTQNLILGLAGLLLFLAVWWLVAEAKSEQIPIGFEQQQLPSSIGADSLTLARIDSLTQLDSIAFANATEFRKVYPIIPTPMSTFQSYPELIGSDDLLPNAWYSIWLNLRGYFWAIMISIPFGFLLGLYPIFRGLFSRQVEAFRFLPLTALVGMFMAWYGTGDAMKIAFLAFGIMVYLIPVIVQRIFEVKDVYLKTVFTLGATDWQTIRSVYIPSVMSKVIDDIRVLTAISWTYIIIAELLNSTQGLGRLIWTSSRTGQTEKVFAILLVFIVIGFLQDRIFVFIDRRLFPHKYVNSRPLGLRESQYGIAIILGVVVLGLILSSILPIGGFIWTTLVPILVIAGLVFIGYGEFKIFRSSTD